jgi:ubiquinone biosynthesis protein UbiJ
LAPLPLAFLEIAINRYLRLDPRALDGLAALSGHSLAVGLVGLPHTLRLDLGPDGVCLAAADDRAADALVRGTPGNLLSMLTASDASGRLFKGDVTIEGDAELVQRIKAIVDDMDVDWEEALSRLVGDPVAHQAGNLARGVAGWERTARHTLWQDLADYLVDEARLVPRREEAAALSNSVDTLRDDLERLEKRVARLSGAIGEGEG